MNILIACEFSATVRDAFRAKGHNAFSCDFLPTEGDDHWHLQEDVLGCLEPLTPWDLMIAHPPCTYLSNAGLHYCKNNPERQKKRDEAVEFVKKLFAAPIEKIAIENPIGYLSGAWQKPTQICYMNHFGIRNARKPTCLWLKNLPKLQDTHIVGFRTGSHGCSEWYRSTRDQKARSKTFPEFAQAMADQWG